MKIMMKLNIIIAFYQIFQCLLESYQGFQRPILKTLMKLFEYV